MSEHPAPLWTMDEFIAATGGRPHGDVSGDIFGISIDTRTLETGDAYFAIKGENMDGHTFVASAAGKGARVAVVCEGKLVTLGAISLPLIIVDDVLHAMERLAVAARARSKARIIAVTGSAGKTTTKEMLRVLLGDSGKIHASPASFNNHWGVPLTLARMPIDAEFGIFEIGMNHHGEIAHLVKMVRPDVAVITIIAPAHLGAFSSLKDIATAKAEIFGGIVKGGCALINRDDKQYGYLSKLAEEAGVKTLISFGEKRGAEYQIKQIDLMPNSSLVSASLSGKPATFTLQLPGQHMVSNLMAAIGAAMVAGGERSKILENIAHIGAESGRGKILKIGVGRRAITLIDESYNANPASMRASLQVLKMQMPTGKGRRVAVLGDMLELGKSSAKLHKELVTPIREANVDKIWLAGEEIAPLSACLEAAELAGHFESAQALSDVLLNDLVPGDVIMVKASNGLKFKHVVDAIIRASEDK